MDANGGQIEWEVKEAKANITELRYLLKESATNTNASVMFRCGSLPDATPVPVTTPAPSTILYEMVVSPNGITKKGLAPVQTIAVRFDKVGNMYQYTKGSVAIVIENDLILTVNNKTETVKGNDISTILGNKTETVTGNITTVAAAQTIRAASQILLDAPVVRAGGASASLSVALADPLITWLSTHEHPLDIPNVKATAPLTGAALAAVVPSRTFKVQG
jgi:hypothetical protein